jgi:hypothetical protein
MGSPIKGHLEAYESVEAAENDYKRNKLLIFEGGIHHGKDED